MRFERLNSQEEVLAFIHKHNENKSSFIVIDCEGTSKDPKESELLDIQLSGIEEEHVVIFSGCFKDSLLALDKAIILVAHNYTYDAHLLFKHGVDLLDRVWRDTLLMSHLADENRESYILGAFVKEYWKDSYKETFWRLYSSYQEAPKQDQIDYACKDIFYTRKLYLKLKETLYLEQSIPNALIEHVCKLQDSLLQTQIQGIKIDVEYLLKIGIKLKTEIERLKPEMRNTVSVYCDLWEMQQYERELQKRKTDKGKLAVSKPKFSFDSATQLKSLFYEQLSLPLQTNEKTKRPTTDDFALENLKETHKLIPLLQEYRQHQKIYTSFIEGTKERINNGRIYPRFRINGTVTGRISHSNPNLAQLPKSGGVRGIYCADFGTCFISADYSQLEVCVEANLTGDTQLAKIFQEGLSKHDITAKELSLARHIAKTLNFALQYWASHYKVAKLLGISEQEAKKIWEAYWRLYQGPKKLKAKTDAAVISGKPLVTAFGRRRRFEQRKRNAWDKDFRQAYNFLVQGTGADITSRAFYLTAEKLKKERWGRGLFTVHDELIIEVKKEVAKEAENFMLETMVKVGDEIGFKIPLKAESSGPMERWESD